MDKIDIDKNFEPLGSFRSLADQQLFSPLEEILNHSGKRIRANIVHAGFLLGSTPVEMTPNEDSLKNLEILGEIIETIHTGSLIVDDVQDNSQLRRGRPALHKVIGKPLAINAGNFLYFWPMTWLKGTSLNEHQQLQVMNLYHQTLTLAHCGQAIDVGTAISQVEAQNVYETCMRSLELKTGELMAMAIGFGAIAAGASQDRLLRILEFGRRFGVALQMFDDLGNLTNKADSKHLEDLILKRPSFIWAAAASLSSSEQYTKFQYAVEALGSEEQKGNSILLWNWIEQTQFLVRAKRKAFDYCDEALRLLNTEVKNGVGYKRAFEIIYKMRERIENAYS